MPPLQRPFIPPGPYLASLQVLALSDAKGFQDDCPFDLLSEPLAPAANLEVLRINRCMGLQLNIEGGPAAGTPGRGRGPGQAARHSPGDRACKGKEAAPSPCSPAPLRWAPKRQ